MPSDARASCRGQVVGSTGECKKKLDRGAGALDKWGRRLSRRIDSFGRGSSTISGILLVVGPIAGPAVRQQLYGSGEVDVTIDELVFVGLNGYALALHRDTG